MAKKAKQPREPKIRMATWTGTDYIVSEPMTWAEINAQSAKCRARSHPKPPFLPGDPAAEEACRAILRALEDHFSRVSGKPRARALAFIREFGGEALALPSYRDLENVLHFDSQPAPLPRAGHQEKLARVTLQLLREYFASRFFKRDASPEQLALELCRAFAATNVSFGPSHIIEKVARDEAVAKAVANGGTQVLRRRLSQLHGISRSEIGRLARQYARGIQKEVDKTRDIKPDLNRLFPAPEKRSEKRV